MAEEKEDVNIPAPSTGEEAVKPAEEEAVQESATEEETPQPTETPAPEGVTEGEEEVDERGVSYKNVAMEYKRKYGELQENLPSMIQQAVEKAIPAKPAEQPQYTKDQLFMFKAQNQDPQSQAWADMELEKLRTLETKQMFESQLKVREERTNFERQQQMALGEVMRKYPLMFNPNGSWNNSHPLTQKLARVYNQTPDFKKHGLGLLGAADSAFSEWILEQQPQVAKRQKQMKRQMKKLEKATLMEGGGQAQPTETKTPLVRAAEELAGAKKKGERSKALTEVARQLLKAKGTIP